MAPLSATLSLWLQGYHLAPRANRYFSKASCVLQHFPSQPRGGPVSPSFAKKMFREVERIRASSMHAARATLSDRVNRARGIEVT